MSKRIWKYYLDFRGENQNICQSFMEIEEKALR